MPGHTSPDAAQLPPVSTRFATQSDREPTQGLSPLGVLASPRRHPLLGLSLSFNGWVIPNYRHPRRFAYHHDPAG
jgi:hypothetical protein